MSAILGFAAEGAKHTDNCTSTVGLGVCAAVFLLIAQAAVSVVGASCGCLKSRGAAIPSETRRLVGVICAVGSWIAAVIASVMLLVGAIQASSCGNYSTGVGAGIFACAGLLALLATGLGIASYIIMLRRQPLPQPGDGKAVPDQQQSPDCQPYDSPPALAQGNGGQAPAAPPSHGGGHGQAPSPQFAAPPPPARGYQSQAPDAQV